MEKETHRLTIPENWEKNVDDHFDQASKTVPEQFQPLLVSSRHFQKCVVWMLLGDLPKVEKAFGEVGWKKGEKNASLVSTMIVQLELINDSGFMIWAPTKSMAATPHWRALIQAYLRKVYEEKWLGEIHYLLIANFVEIICEKGKKLSEEEIKEITGESANKA